MDRILYLVSSVSGFLAVALGAFGAHGLEKRLAALPDYADRMRWWTTAAHYHLVHAVAIGVVAAAVARIPAAQTAGFLFLAGTLLFSGSLYTMTLTGIRVLGAVTPFGGLLMLAGWAQLGYAAYCAAR